MGRLTKKKPELNMYVFDRDVEYANFEDGLVLLQIVGRLEDLEEEIGCPLEVRCRITTDTTIYDAEGNSFEVEYIHDNYFSAIMNRGFGSMYDFDFKYSDYKKTWFLKKDKSE